MKTEFEMETAFNSGDNAFGFPLNAAADEESCIVDGMTDKLSFRALFSLCLNHEGQSPLLHLLFPHAISAASSNFNCLPYEVHPPMTVPENVALEAFNAFPATLIRSLACGGDSELKLKMPTQELSTQFGSLNAFPETLIRSLDCGGDLEHKLEMPRQELSTQFGSYGYNNGGAISTEPSNFLADVIREYGFPHLPDLRSLEKQPVNLNTEFGSYGGGAISAEPSNFLADVIREYGFGHLPDLRSLEKRPTGSTRNIGGASQGHILEKSTGNYQPVQAPTPRYQPPRQPRKAPKPESRSTILARERRKKQGEKTRLLQKLMPWETKMDMARMYEEAYKYVKFLQAQVSVLQNMPARGALPSPNTNSAALHGPLLARLSRQQLLEVMVNSPAIQKLLYSKGCCVFSVEQLAEIGKVIDRKFLFEQMLIASASISRA